MRKSLKKYTYATESRCHTPETDDIVNQLNISEKLFGKKNIELNFN